MSKRILNRTVIACLSRTFEFAFISLFVASKSKDTSGWKFSLYDNCERDERIVERGTKAKKNIYFLTSTICAFVWRFIRKQLTRMKTYCIHIFAIDLYHKL